MPVRNVRSVVRWYSTTEVAERLGVTEMTARRWAAAGRFGAARVGKQWHFQADEVDAARPELAIRRELEIAAAVRKVLSSRRLQDWLPDALLYRDISEDRRLLSGIVRERWTL